MKIFTQILKAVSVMIFCLVVNNEKTYAKWEKKMDMSVFAQGRWGIQMLTVNNKIFAGGGYEGNDIVANDWMAYDIATNKWTMKNNMPGTNTNRAGGVTFTINGKAYLGLGIENFNSFSAPWNFLKDLWEYNDATDTWTKKADFPGTGVGFCGVFVVNNKAYVVGGDTGKQSNDATNQVYEYDPATNKWTKKADFPETFITNQPYAFSINNKGYISCGQIPGANTDKTYEYDPVANKWTAKKSFPAGPVSGGVSFSVYGRGYCGLGSKGSSVFPLEFYSYDPVSDNWSYSAGYEFPLWGRMYAKAVVVDNKVYLGAGWRIDGTSQRWFKDFYQIDPVVAAGVNNIDENSKTIIYPNPAKDVVFVNSDSRYTSYIIYSLTGCRISSGFIGAGNSIPVGMLTTGQYIMELTSPAITNRSLLTIE